MKISFVTTNKHKFDEVERIVSPYNIALEHLDMEYDENHDADMQTIVFDASKRLSSELGKPIVLEDTGIFFEAYNGFPGPFPKFVFGSLGFKGIFKLLEGEIRDAYFLTVVGYCEPQGKPKIFEGKMHGKITEEIFDQDKHLMPYDHIFVPQGKTMPISRMLMDEKNGFSQRGEAFRKFAKSITS